jgi:hypothetical protein
MVPLGKTAAGKITTKTLALFLNEYEKRGYNFGLLVLFLCISLDFIYQFSD